MPRRRASFTYCETILESVAQSFHCFIDLSDPNSTFTIHLMPLPTRRHVQPVMVSREFMTIHQARGSFIVHVSKAAMAMTQETAENGTMWPNQVINPPTIGEKKNGIAMQRFRVLI